MSRWVFVGGDICYAYRIKCRGFITQRRGAQRAHSPALPTGASAVMALMPGNLEVCDMVLEGINERIEGGEPARVEEMGARSELGSD